MKRYPNLYHVKFLLLSAQKVNEWNIKFELPVWEDSDIEELEKQLSKSN